MAKEFEDWVLWHLPLCRALAYQHCALRSNGEWTVPVDKPIGERLRDMEAKRLDYLMRHDECEELEEDFDGI